jgi:serine/threonine protein kinase
VQLIGAVTSQSSAKIVTELMECSLYPTKGNSIECTSLFRYAFLRKGPLNSDLQLKIALQIASGMFYLISNNPPIYHRDLKSQNVLLDSSNRAKLTDFGLSTIKTVSASQVSKVGTPAWSAPEGKESVTYNDIYNLLRSFGC